MDRLEKFREQRTEAVTELNELLNKADVEKRADLTQDEQNRWNELDSHIERLSARIVLEERAQKLSLEQNEATGSRIPAEAVDAEAEEQRSAKKSAGGAINRAATNGPSLGEIAQEVRSQALTGQVNQKFQTRAALSGTIPSDGGYLLNPTQADDLLNRAFAKSVLMDRVRTIEIGANSNSLTFPYIESSSRVNGSRFGGMDVRWLGEGQQKPESKIQWRTGELKLQKMAGIMYAPDELVEDATALGSWINDAFESEMGFQFDDAVLNGNGVGRPLGIRKSPALITVAKETSQVADTLLYPNVLKMFSRVWAANMNTAIWGANNDIIPALGQMVLPIGTAGTAVYLPSGGAAGAMFQTLFARPIEWFEQLPTLGDEGDLLLFDPREYLVIRKGGIQKATSIHIHFDKDETCFRFVVRLNGMPLWDKPVTPANGGSTKSPFVTLAERA